VPIELSKVDEGAVQPEKKQLTITLSTEPGGPDNEGMVYLDDTPVGNWIDLRRALMELKNRDPEALVLIRPDKNIITERLLKVMGMAHACGILHYGVAAEQPVSADITAPLPADGAAPAPPAAEPAPAAAPAPAAGGK
jgi:biopolymer transport protein ExbD